MYDPSTKKNDFSLPTSTWLPMTAMDESGALDVLGLSERESYSAAEVRRAYRRMALLYHPDKLQSPSKVTEEEGSVKMMDDCLEIGKMILVGVFRGETQKHQETCEFMVHVESWFATGPVF